MMVCPACTWMIQTKKEPVSSGTSGNSSKNGEVDRPALYTDSSVVSIENLLQYVNDNLKQSYVNQDRTTDYGIYFGDNKMGSVMYITPKDITYVIFCIWHIECNQQYFPRKREYS